jgi:hypothetical protein
MRVGESAGQRVGLNDRNQFTRDKRTHRKDARNRNSDATQDFFLRGKVFAKRYGLFADLPTR